MTQEITAIDRLMLVMANNIAKQVGLPEFYASHIYTSPEQEIALVAAVKKQFTLIFDGSNFVLAQK